MPKIFPVTIKRIIEIVGGGGGNGFIASVLRIGIRLTNRFTLIAAEVRAGFRLAISAITFRGPPVRVGVRTSLLGAVGTLGQQVAKVGVRLTASIRNSAATNVVVRPALRLVASLTSASGTTIRPAFRFSRLGVVGTLGQQTSRFGIDLSPRISEFHLTSKLGVNFTQIVFNLNKLAGANSNSSVGTAWTNPANAHGDAPNSTFATIAGAALAVNGGIILGYANSVNKSELTITAATLNFYARVTGDATGLLSDLTLSYDIGAGSVVLETIAGNFDNTASPRSFSIPLTTWTQYDALTSRLDAAFSAAAIGVTAAVDAVTIVIVANKTDIL